MVPKVGSPANCYTHQKSKTDQDHLKIKVCAFNAASIGEEMILYQHYPSVLC